MYLFLILWERKINDKNVNNIILVINPICQTEPTLLSNKIAPLLKAISPHKITEILKICEPIIEEMAADKYPFLANENSAIISGIAVVVDNNRPPAELVLIS